MRYDVHMTWTWYTQEERASWPSEHKKCRSCQEVLPFTNFHKHKQALYGYANVCKRCRKPASQAEWQGKSFEKSMLATSRFRAKKKGIPHTIQLSDIVIPERCPILDVPIVLERGHPYAPSLDQIVPRAGYTPDNIMVVSNRANHLKLNMTLEEGRKVVNFLETLSVTAHAYDVQVLTEENDEDGIVTTLS